MHLSLREAFLFDDRQRCAILWRARLAPAGGGELVEIDGVDLALVRGGRLARNEVYFDRAALAGVGLARGECSRPGRPTDNSFVESFNGSLRDECLNVHWFETLEEAKEKIEAWRLDYNESRPHQALAELAPAEFVARAAELEKTTRLQAAED